MKICHHVILLILISAFAGAAFAQQPRAQRPVRVGTYDNRAIALAYYRSEANPVNQMMKKYREAEEQGDTAKMEELKAWGSRQQALAHKQGFGHYPVSEIMQKIRERVRPVLEKHNLVAIAWEYDCLGEGVEMIDITEDPVLHQV